MWGGVGLGGGGRGSGVCEWSSEALVTIKKKNFFWGGGGRLGESGLMGMEK